MNNNTKVLLSLLVVAIVAIAGFMAVQNKSFFGQSGQNNSPEQSEVKNPSFVMGNVVRTSGQTMVIKVGAEEKTAVITGETKLIKQVKQNDGSILPAVATLADFTASRLVVVYYFDSTAAGYQATKIQIIN